MARCGVHPDVVADETCHRCGTFLCEECVGYAAEDRVFCDGCAGQVRRVEALPWDEAPTPISFAESLGRVIAHPVRTFSRMGPREDSSSHLGFSIAGGMVAHVLSTGVVFALTPPADPFMFVGRTVCGCVGGVIVWTLIPLILGGIVHLAGRALGGDGRFDSMARAAGYAFPVLVFTSYLGGALPFLWPRVVGILVVLIGGWGFFIWALGLTVTHAHRLSRPRALLAASSPMGLILVVTALVLVIGSV